MTRLKIILFFLFSLCTTLVFSTTWDEPWQDKVIKEADYFVFAKIRSFDENKGATIEIIRSLGGQVLNGKIKISDFYLLDLCSGGKAEFDFDEVKECYFFLKKNKQGNYSIATPTSGFAKVKEGNVYASYRHSYHQALVPADIYEKTMAAIFNNYHNQPYDNQFIIDYVNRYLSVKPAGFDDADTFFGQHVSLECIYHLRLPNFYAKIIPFLYDTSNFHNQVSAARALIAYNSSECKQELLKVISDTGRSHFVQVICVWTLTEFKPKELKEQLIKIKETASDADTGFGGNIMDPRVCTAFPNMKEAIEKLIGTI